MGTPDTYLSAGLWEISGLVMDADADAEAREGAHKGQRTVGPHNTVSESLRLSPSLLRTLKACALGDP